MADQDIQQPTAHGPTPDTVILDQFPDPVILLNRRREVLFANTAAGDVLSGRFAGRDLALSFRHPAVLEIADRVIGTGRSLTVDISVPSPVQRSFLVRALALDDEAAAAMLIFEDVTGARAAEEMRADFIANVSHELRSPISSLVGFIETLRGPAADDEGAREKFLAMMAEEARRMSRLIDDLLSLSRVETMEHVRPGDMLDIGMVLRSTAEMLTLRAEEKNMMIKVDCAANLPPVIGDHDELVQVFHNLFDNAVKYGRRGTVVNVRVTPAVPVPGSREPGLSIAVTDEGGGIAQEHLARLTERFYRVDKGRSRELGGTGLGLAIVKHIVNRHRGHLAIRSEVGEGATFTVHLPIESEPRSAQG